MKIQETIILVLALAACTKAEISRGLRKKNNNKNRKKNMMMKKKGGAGPKLVATLELEGDVKVEYMYYQEGVFVTAEGGPDAQDVIDEVEAKTEELGAKGAYEALSGKSAPKALVRAQRRADQKDGTYGIESADFDPPPVDGVAEITGDGDPRIDPTPEDEGAESEMDESGDEDGGNGQSNRRLATRLCYDYYERTGNQVWTPPMSTYYIAGQLRPYRGCAGLRVEYWNYRLRRYVGIRGRSVYVCPGQIRYAYYRSSRRYYLRLRTYNAYRDAYHTRFCYGL